ncbi:MAG: hypothetical protein AAF202_02860 [Pseudomonadota bacterium]
MRNRTGKLSVICGTVLAMSLLSACGSEDPSFSILPDTENFQQSTESINTRIDILWVIDNSGSMNTSQTQLASNFQSFIEDFETKNFDFQMAVTTTDAYLAHPNWEDHYDDFLALAPTSHAEIYDGAPQADKSLFRDGVAGTYSGISIMDQNTENLSSVFNTNILQGIDGYGDERAFESLRLALEDARNSGLVRENSFLAVIIVTDEDDFSHPGFWVDQFNRGIISDNTDPALDPIEDYLTFLDGLTSSSQTIKNYNVSSITIKDTDCIDTLNAQQSFTERIVADRVLALAAATEGTQGDLCGNFAEELSDIAENIITKANIFFLDRVPIPETIKVVVNGSVVPNLDFTGGTEGYNYDADNNAIVFTAGAVPPQGAQIAVNFDPVSLDD